MLTYQLQNRIFKIKNQKKFEFPSDAEVEIYFEPSEQFGIGEKSSKTVVKGSKLHIIYDANTGKYQIFSSPRLEPIEVTLEWTNLQLEMRGNVFHAKWKCETFKDLESKILTFHYIVPILLNLELMEPPAVKYTCGHVGDAEFRWELQETKLFFCTASIESQETCVAESFSRLELLSEVSNRRLAAALYYFYVARRLTEAGNSPYEFLAEVVLNLCKALQVMFGETRDHVRAGLLKFGYTKEEIEEKFIPIMILRNELDVGHVTVKTFKRNQLRALYNYLSLSEGDFRDMLKRAIRKTKELSYKFRQDSHLSLTEDEQKKIDKLVNIFISRDQKEMKKRA